MVPPPSTSERWRRAALAAAVLALACFNLTFRIDRETLTEWDESLYATTAWEAVTDGHWLGTTVDGELDYYNTKPPLNVWLIAASFKLFGPGFVSLRLTSICSAFLTIALLLWWTWRHLGPRGALLASTILSTTFGFLHVHSGRTANTDALFTLLIVLTAMTLVGEEARPWRRAWLGPILAAVFLLRGMAVLMPLAIVILTDIGHVRATARRWAPSFAALALFLVPAGAWVIARYQLDGWAFLGRMVGYDFVQRTVQPLEGHGRGLLYYLEVLHQNQFDWLAGGFVALCVVGRASWLRMGGTMHAVRSNRFLVVIGSWALVTLAVPTVMQTKLAWYLTPFYPVFALGLAMLIVRAFADVAAATRPRWHAAALAATLVVVVSAAEVRLLWYSFAVRDLRYSGQSLLLAERQQLRGRRVFQDRQRRAATFVAGALIGARPQAPVVDPCCVLRDVSPGDYLLTADRVAIEELELLRSNGIRWLYRRR
jgi:4-amino-4-deoxy-L-arabinose transferase-like glycosyltransferase